MTEKNQLFFLHFAGGNSYSYQFMLPYLKEFEVIQLELPGRGKRMKEKLIHDFSCAAEDMYQQILHQQTSSSFIMYGHSLGAYLTLNVAEMLQRAGRAPAFIIVSGNAGPGIGDGKKRYQMNKQELITELRTLGGFPEEVIENKELFDFFEPVLRADFELAENHVEIGSQLHIPIIALMGSKEKDMNRISNWQRFTSSDFQFEIMDGDHFFIYKNPQRIARIIQQYNEQRAIVL